MFMAHPKLCMDLLGHEIGVGCAGVLTGCTDVPTMQPLVTVGDTVLMGEQPSALEACFGAGLEAISFYNLVEPDPSLAVTAMRAAFNMPGSPGAQLSKADAVVMALACLAQHYVRLRNAFAEDRQQARALAGSS